MTGAQTSETTWHGQPAIALDTAALRLVTVPQMGAKLVSLVDKQTGREWLVPPVDRQFTPVTYGARFVDQDMSGWDEMFPTIDACAYPVEGSYYGAALPDHGEVWALPWHVDAVTNDSLRLSTNGHALPYQLTRTLHAVSDSHISVAFEAVNTGTEPFVALWAAHPQFAADADTRIVLPPSTERVISVYWPDDARGSGHVHAWPTAHTHDGRPMQLDQIGAASLRQCRKFYLPPNEPVGWAAVQQGAAGEWVRLSWNTADVPYLGLWVDEGTYSPLPVAALEPATGYFDRLDLAWRNNAVMRFDPHQPVRWQLSIELGAGTLVP